MLIKFKIRYIIRNTRKSSKNNKRKKYDAVNLDHGVMLYMDGMSEKQPKVNINLINILPTLTQLKDP